MSSVYILTHEKSIRRGFVQLLESVTVKRLFDVGKGTKVPPGTDIAFTQTYGQRPIIEQLIERKGKTIVHIGGNLWDEYGGQRADLMAKLLRKKDVLAVCISKHLAKIVDRRMRGNAKVVALPGGLWGLDHTRHGIMPQRFSPPRTKWVMRKHPIVGMNISLTVQRKWSGLDVFFGAVNQVARKNNVQFVCAGAKGTGKENLVKYWRANHNMIYVDSSAENWPKMMRSFDLFVHSSMYDAFGRSVADAMCCAIPVLGYATSGVNEISDKLRLVDPRDHETMEWQFNKLLTCEPIERKKYANSLRKEALRKTEKHREDYVKLLEAFLRGDPYGGLEPVGGK